MAKTERQPWPSGDPEMSGRRVTGRAVSRAERRSPAAGTDAGTKASPCLELSDAEARALRDAVAEYVSDLGTEIAATEAVDFREELKHKRELLQSVLDRLS
jgi:hypothetical protein